MNSPRTLHAGFQNRLEHAEQATSLQVSPRLVLWQPKSLLYNGDSVAAPLGLFNRLRLLVMRQQEHSFGAGGCRNQTLMSAPDAAGPALSRRCRMSSAKSCRHSSARRQFNTRSAGAALKAAPVAAQRFPRNGDGGFLLKTTLRCRPGETLRGHRGAAWHVLTSMFDSHPSKP